MWSFGFANSSFLVATQASVGWEQRGAATGANLDHLIKRLAGFARAATGEGRFALITRERHRLAFEAAAKALSSLLNERDAPVEITAEYLREAAWLAAELAVSSDDSDRWESPC